MRLYTAQVRRVWTSTMLVAAEDDKEAREKAMQGKFKSIAIPVHPEEPLEVTNLVDTGELSEYSARFYKLQEG